MGARPETRNPESKHSIPKMTRWKTKPETSWNANPRRRVDTASHQRQAGKQAPGIPLEGKTRNETRQGGHIKKALRTQPPNCFGKIKFFLVLCLL